MHEIDPNIGCGAAAHFNRRTLLKAAGLSGIGWLTPLAECLAREAESAPRGAQAKSVIVLWLQGGPSQLETFDPHPGTAIAAGSKARNTSVKGIQLAEGFEQLADLMQHVSLVRSVISKEGDHERATYNMKTGFRPDPTLIHPALGSIICHKLSDNVEIPRHVSILSGGFPPRGGDLGPELDAFKINDPLYPLPDLTPRVTPARLKRRLDELSSVVEAEFARGRIKELDAKKTLHEKTIAAARRMMDSDQLKAFDVTKEPESTRGQFGDSPFGRGCLAAIRLVQVGVRCVEVTLNGWDTHANNHENVAALVKTLDPAFAALIPELRSRSLLDSTIVLCGGEFGRTPGRPGADGLNVQGGRDHWPHGFSVAIAGGGIRGGLAVGETSASPAYEEKNRTKNIVDPWNVEDVHATILHALGIAFDEQWFANIGRSMHFSEGKVIQSLLAAKA